MDFRPITDGIDHINAYSKGRTPIGRKLTNFAHTPFDHPIYGHFESLEGFWFWFITGMQYNNLRKVHGYQAKELGRVCLGDSPPIIKLKKGQTFQDVIIDVTKCKLRQNTDVLQMLVETGDLPIFHYYYDYKSMNLEDAKVEYLKEYQWHMDAIMEIRKQTQEWMKRKNIKSIKNFKFK